MTAYTGSMSIYFPCKLKQSSFIKRFNGRWNRWQQRQINYIHHSHAPLTDLMDKERNRNIKESFLNVMQRTFACRCPINEECSPFALRCLRLAYRKNREDNLFAKNVQVVLSRFSMEYCIKNKGTKLKTDGVLLLNVNADNAVATLIVVLNFKNFQAEELVYLKHVFYKRLLVNIKESDTSLQNCDCSKCNNLNWLECLRLKQTNKVRRTIIQDFVNEKSQCVLSQHRLQYDVDYRARYSFIELERPKLRRKNCLGMVLEYLVKGNCDPPYRNESFLRELYGILHSDEGFGYTSNEVLRSFDTNYSTRAAYDLYLSGLDALILTKNSTERDLCKVMHAKFEEGYNEAEENIRTEPIVGRCIPGVSEEFFPSFLKAVEIHYLINKIMTNEIAIHERSFLYPWIFIKRLWLLWEILYDVDSHKYHINRNFQTAFGISEQLEDIRQEYNTLLAHTLSYSMAIITIIAAIFTFIQLWK